MFIKLSPNNIEVSKSKQEIRRAGIVAYTYNTSIQEAEARRATRVLGHPGPQSQAVP